MFCLYITGCRIHNNGVGAVLGGDNFVVSSNAFADNGKHLVDQGGANKQMLGNLFSGGSTGRRAP